MFKSTKKLISLIMSALLTFSTVSVTSYAQSNNSDISVQNVAITSINKNLTKSGNTYTCFAVTRVQSGYTAGVMVELQQNISGSWTTIKSWSNKAALIASVNESKTVASGEYRMKSLHYSYDANGKLLEVKEYYTYE